MMSPVPWLKINISMGSSITRIASVAHQSRCRPGSYPPAEVLPVQRLV